MLREEVRKVNSGGELKITEEEEGETEPFKDKVLGTSKLQEENKETSMSPKKKPEFLRMQSQIALPVVNKNE